MKNFLKLNHALMVTMMWPTAVFAQAETPVAPTIAVPLSDEAFDWKLQPPVGLRGRYVIFTRTRISQNFPALPTRNGRAKTSAQRIEVNSQQTMAVDYETISRDAQGGTVSRLTYGTFKQNATQKINGRTVPMPRDANEKAMEKMFDGLEIDIKQGPDGRIWSIQGLDAMRRRFNAALPKDNAVMTAAMKPFFDSVFSEKTMRQEWDFSVYQPAAPVRVGESWKYKIPLDMAGINMEFRGTRQLKSLNPSRANVSDRANISLNLGSAFKLPATMKNPPKIKMSGGGTLTGAAVVDRATGLQIEAHTDQRWVVKTSVETIDNGRTVEMEMPQWFLVQTRQVFRPRE